MMKMGQFRVSSTGLVLVFICLAVAQASYYSHDEDGKKDRWVDARNGFVIPIEGDPDFPWLVSIVTMKNRIAYCGGSLINTRAVLTSASCVDGKALIPMEFELWKRGEASIKSRQIRNSSQVIVHENYDKTKIHNDVAIVIFSEPVFLDDDAHMAHLPELDVPINLAKCISSGWGFYLFIPKEFSPKKIYPSLIDDTTCQNALIAVNPYIALDSSTFCTNDQPYLNDCQVDHGTPLLCPILHEPSRYVQVGLAASSYCSHHILPIAWTDVRAARGWIMEKLSENGLM